MSERKRSSKSTGNNCDDDLPLSMLHETGSKKAPPKFDEIPQAELQNSVCQRVESFIRSGRFSVSSDEDEIEFTSSNLKTNLSPKSVFMMGSGRHEAVPMENSVCTQNVYGSEAGTNAHSKTCNDDEIEIIDDDVMTFVDSVLTNTSFANLDNPKKEIKSLQTFRKETEDMMKNVSCLLDQIGGTTSKSAAKVNETRSPSKVTVGSCPICMESLSDRPASVTVCGHIFCKHCILKTAKTTKKCPTCRKTITVKKIHPIFL